MNIKKVLLNTLFYISPRKALYYMSKDEFKSKLMDQNFPWKKYDNSLNPYFLQWGFRFSSLESKYYSQCTGVESDFYVPLGLFNHVILPFLNNTNWRIGFADKNIANRMLDVIDTQQHIDVRFTECITSCQNGHFYIAQNTPCGYDDSIQEILNYRKDFIIKPSVDSSHGKGIKKILAEEINRELIENLYKQYGKNFTVQKVLVQHPSLAAFNPTSINTIRITTYQDFNGNVKILYAAQRFGGKGKIYDNADDPNGSGGFCAISMDGIVDRKVHHYRNMKTDILDDAIPNKIPCFEKIKDAVIFLHRRFPHYGIIGWDASLTPDGHPVIIEYNFVPGMGTGQLANFPFFPKEDLDEIMKRIHNFRTKLSVHVKMEV